MKNKSKIFYFFVGTTAELLRVAPIIKELKVKKIKYKLFISGQNKVDIKEISKYTGRLSPIIRFKEKINKSSSLIFFFWAFKAFFVTFIKVYKESKNTYKKDIIFVIAGDPISTVIGAIVAKLQGIKLIHLESGDLSGNLLEPFPEEICRHINLTLSDVLFPPSTWAMSNISRYNKPKINTYFNTYLESFNFFLKLKIDKKRIPKRKYFILILHRQEHVFFKKEWSKKTLELVINTTDPNLQCVIFNHPLTVEIINSLGIDVHNNERFTVMPHISYSQFLYLMKNSEFIATDGASNQFEAYLMGVPSLILRDHTEQIEGIGENVVMYKSNKKTLKSFLKNYTKYRRKPVKTRKRPSKIVVDYLLR